MTVPFIIIPLVIQGGNNMERLVIHYIYSLINLKTMRSTSLNSNRSQQRHFFIGGMIVLLALTVLLIITEQHFFQLKKWQVLVAVVLSISSVALVMTVYRYVKYGRHRMMRKGKLMIGRFYLIVDMATAISILGLIAFAVAMTIFFSTGCSGATFWWFVVVNVFAIRVIYLDHRSRVLRSQGKTPILRVVR